MSFLFLATFTATFVFAATVDQRCKEMNAKYQKDCQLEDMHSNAAFKSAPMANLYSHCKGAMKDVTTASVIITESSPPGTNSRPLRRCEINASTSKGTAVRIYNSLGNSLSTEAHSDGSVETSVTTADGSRVTCSRGASIDTEVYYTSCRLRINNQWASIPLKDNFELGRVLMNLAPIQDLKKVTITAPALPAAQ